MMRSTSSGAVIALLLFTSHGAHASEGDCKRRVAALEKTIAPLTIGDHLTFTTTVLGAEAPTARRGEVVKTPGLVLELKGTEAALEGVRFEEKAGPALGAEVSKRLDQLLAAEEQAPTREGQKAMPAYAWIDAKVKLADALPALCTLAEKRNTSLVVARKGVKEEKRPTATGPKWLEDELRNASEIPNARPSILSRSLNRAIGGCEALVDRLAKLPDTPREQGRGFKRALVEGLTECKCEGADVDALLALVVRAIADGPTRWAVPLPLRCAAKKSEAAELRVPKDATVAKLVELLEARMPADADKPFRIVLE